MIDPDRLLALALPERRCAWDERDTMLYALGIGHGSDPMDEADLRYACEHAQLRAAPTMLTVLGWDRSWIPATGIDWPRVVHGEHRIALEAPLPVRGEAVVRSRITEVIDKGMGAVFRLERRLADAGTDEPLGTCTTSFFVRGAGGSATPAAERPAQAHALGQAHAPVQAHALGQAHAPEQAHAPGQAPALGQGQAPALGQAPAPGKPPALGQAPAPGQAPSPRHPPSHAQPPAHCPDRAPDAIQEAQTFPHQALLYRLSGDRNPHHAWPPAARAGGFERPLLHGLATFGYAGRAVLRAFGEPAWLEARFLAPVFPGDALRFALWREGGEVLFRGSVGPRAVIQGRSRTRGADTTKSSVDNRRLFAHNRVRTAS